MAPGSGSSHGSTGAPTEASDALCGQRVPLTPSKPRSWGSGDLGERGGGREKLPPPKPRISIPFIPTAHKTVNRGLSEEMDEDDRDRSPERERGGDRVSGGVLAPSLSSRSLEKKRKDKSKRKKRKAEAAAERSAASEAAGLAEGEGGEGRDRPSSGVKSPVKSRSPPPHNYEYAEDVADGGSGISRKSSSKQKKKKVRKKVSLCFQSLGVFQLCFPQ